MISERVLLVLERHGDGPDGMPIRLRHLLKALVRRFGLRCVWHQDVPEDWRPPRAVPVEAFVTEESERL